MSKPETRYQSDIVLGEEYADTQTEVKGRATALYFYEFMCERVCLEYMSDGKIVEHVFDAPRLQRVSSGARARNWGRTGGPHDSTPVPR